MAAKAAGDSTQSALRYSQSTQRKEKRDWKKEIKKKIN
jgi:hypothetical protein